MPSWFSRGLGAMGGLPAVAKRVFSGKRAATGTLFPALLHVDDVDLSELARRHVSAADHDEPPWCDG